ncbi:MAG: hypothetical protein AAGN35_02150 [Bacteroidota bacterium]
MNFISHFYADRGVQDALFIVGTVTPDLMSIYNAKYRVKNSHLNKFDRLAHPEVPRSFLKGLERHFFVDRIFHDSDNFRRETERISQELPLRLPQYDIQRKFFIGHLLLELLMDKIIIDRDPRILEEFYGHFADARQYAPLQQFTGLVAGHTLGTYVSFLRKFYENKYLYKYQEYAHLIWVLGQLLRRVRVESRDFLHAPAFLDYMKEYETGLVDRFEIFFTEIHNAEGFSFD